MPDLSSQPTTIQTLYTWFRSGRLIVNRRYQRKLVWTLEEKQKLIDSVLLGYPIPAILLAETATNPDKYEVLDGMQRMHAIMSFIETAYPTEDEVFFDLTHFPTARSHCNNGAFTDYSGDSLLSQTQVSSILDYTLATSIMRQSSIDQINEVFDRINSFGHRLSDQERRQSGVQNEFSEMVRLIACGIRGDVSTDILPLYQMPSVSIDLPNTRHGYEVKANDVFWVRNRIVRSTDLRDSMDEQCIADIAACIIGGQLIDRSRSALDAVYDDVGDELARIQVALEVYGKDKFQEEFRYIIQEIERIVEESEHNRLNEILFRGSNNNAYPAVFAAIFIALHELIIEKQKRITSYTELSRALKDIAERLNAGQGGANSEQRRANVDTAKGIIERCFVLDKNIRTEIYSDPKTVDIDEYISRSQIELARFELKQGLLELRNGAENPEPVLQKIMETICGIANIGPESEGRIVIGVCDKVADAGRVEKIDGVTGRKVGTRNVVGVVREAKRMNVSVEEYVTLVRNYIANAEIGENLRQSVLGALNFNDYFGLGIIVVAIPAQQELSLYEGKVFYREGDQTVVAEKAVEIATIAQRFGRQP